MEDIQSQRDDRDIPLDQVGVSGLRYPIIVLDQKREKQHTIATLSMSVSLPAHFKGTHMSRFIEVLNEHRGEVTMRTLPTICNELRSRLEAESARVEVHFPYFVEKAAPESGAVGLMDYECRFVGEVNAAGDDQFTLGVTVPVTSLCPCSKAISDYGAHNQRGYISIDVQTKRENDGRHGLVWVEELIDCAERSASAPVYPLLKRADERFVTMQAYDNPCFVEDIARDVASLLRADTRVACFEVHVVNRESIHNHDAFAVVRSFGGES